MTLTKEMIGENKSIESYLVVICNPLLTLEEKDTKSFREEFIDNPTNLFCNNTNPQKALDLFNKCRYRFNLPPSKMYRSVIKINGDYYHGGLSRMCPNKERDKRLTISLYERFEQEDHHQYIIENLHLIVEDGLSMGDKLLIKNIAIKAFHNALELSIEQGYLNLQACLDTHLNEWAVNELHRFGFKLKDLPFTKTF